jgi:PemK-like, MazF-like toxin of type II toxin-antitoxin system
LFDPGDVVIIDFPGVTGIKRRPTVVISSPVYHASRPDIVVGLLTSQTIALGPTDYMLQGWVQAGLRVPSVFRSFFATYLPLPILYRSDICQITIGKAFAPASGWRSPLW